VPVPKPDGQGRNLALQLSDRITGSCLAALGAVTVYGASLQPSAPGQDVGPGVFPTIIGLGLVGCGAMVALGVGHSFEAPDDVIPAEPGQAVPQPPSHAGLRAFLPPLLLIFYVLAAEPLGFVPTAFVMAAAVAFAMGASARLALAIAVLAPLAVHLVFTRLLRVPLPDGLLPMPW
jgi:putative tricarboxylic transport membrane protein